MATRFYDMLAEDAAFKECDFDDADFRNIETDSLTIDDCTLRRADLTNLVCPELHYDQLRGRGRHARTH